MGRSLSLVSRYMHDASKAVRFQMVTCRNAAQIIAFAFILDQTLPCHRIVRHLFLSCCSRYSHHPGFPRVNPQRMSHTPFSSPTASQPLLSTMTMHPVEKIVTFDMLMSRYRQALSVVPRILSQAAQTLNSLSLHIDWPSSEIFFPSHLPVLVDLSISQPWARWHLRSKELGQLVSCPSLRRLALNGFAYIDDPAEIIDSIRTFAPSLTHLCIPREPARLEPRLKELMDQPTPSEDAVFPRTLQLLLIHDPEFIGCEAAWLEDPRFVAVGRSWTYARGVGPLELQWEHQWFDGIDGGQGFWRKPDGANTFSIRRVQ